MKLRKQIKTVKKSPAKLRKGHVTEREEIAGRAKIKQPVKVLVNLDKQTLEKFDRMAFKQVQTQNRMESLEKSVVTLMQSVSSMASMVDGHMKRLRSAPAAGEGVVFHHKMFNKISIKLRKRAIDVLVEDLHNGIKRKRVFRCADYSKVEHFMATRTLAEGIEELAPRPARVPKKKKTTAKKQTKRTKTVADVRYEMEREGLRNQIVPSQGKSRYFDETASATQAQQNKQREKAEKVIVKLCSAGGLAENAKDQELLDALMANGFTDHVAFYAASNCGRITDPKVIKKYDTSKKSKAPATSNEY